MSTTPVTLDSIRAAAERKYGSYDIDLDGEVISLLNPLRLSKAKRDQMRAMQDELDAEGIDEEAVLSDLLRLVAKTEVSGEHLIDAIGGDVAVLASLFEAYGQAVQVGEASASQG